MILLRSTGFDKDTARLAHLLQTVSGERICLLVDERHSIVQVDGFEKIGINRAVVDQMGLYAPRDFAWRCGDYGFYIARHRYSDEACFWMIEYDVRIGGKARDFFEMMARHPDLDFLTTNLRYAKREWYWRRAITSNDATPFQCLFPIVRLTVRAIDMLLAKRQQQSHQPRRRLFWPNDESFVATTMMASSLHAADFLTIDPFLYNDSTFKYHGAFDERTIAPSNDQPVLYHPVLSGEALARKIARLSEEKGVPPIRERIAAKMAFVVNQYFAW